jgi:hypothetical protein
MERLVRHALTISATALLLAGCGGLQSASVPGALPQGRAITLYGGSHQSLALPNALGRDLLYVTGASTNLYTYPNGKLISTLQVNGFAMCSNSVGDVFITNASGVAEYPHGSADQIAFLPGPFGSVDSCSIDPTTGDLAVASASELEQGVGIYRDERHHRWRRPHVFPFVKVPLACSYDSAGNLFVLATLSNDTFLFELPTGGSAFERLTLHREILSPGYLQWDGKYLAVNDTRTMLIHRFTVRGKHAKQIGSVSISGAREIGNFWIQGNILIGMDAYDQYVGFWHYPQGGTPFKTRMMTGPHGATVSLARH